MARNEFLERNRGKRLQANKVKVRLGSNGQFSLTIPRKIASGEKLEKGTILEFEKSYSGLIVLRKVDK